LSASEGVYFISQQLCEALHEARDYTRLDLRSSGSVALRRLARRRSPHGSYKDVDWRPKYAKDRAARDDGSGGGGQRGAKSGADGGEGGGARVVRRADVHGEGPAVGGKGTMRTLPANLRELGMYDVMYNPDAHSHSTVAPPDHTASGRTEIESPWRYHAAGIIAQGAAGHAAGKGYASPEGGRAAGCSSPRRGPRRSLSLSSAQQRRTAAAAASKGAHAHHHQQAAVAERDGGTLLLGHHHQHAHVHAPPSASPIHSPSASTCNLPARTLVVPRGGSSQSLIHSPSFTVPRGGSSPTSAVAVHSTSGAARGSTSPRPTSPIRQYSNRSSSASSPSSPAVSQAARGGSTRACTHHQHLIDALPVPASPYSPRHQHAPSNNAPSRGDHAHPHGSVVSRPVLTNPHSALLLDVQTRLLRSKRQQLEP